MTARALRLRRDRPDLFTSYTPLHADGPAADHVVAFDRGGAVTVVTRLPYGLARRGGWAETTLTLPDRSVRRVADLLAGAPAASWPAHVMSSVVTRLPYGLARRGGWAETTLTLPDRSVRRVADLLAGAPAAVLTPEDMT